MTKANTSYKELWVSVGSGSPFFSETCPICGAIIREDNQDYYKGPIYECGGQYTFKPQIQTHTDKWWGSCPAKYMEELEKTTLLSSTKTVVWLVKEDGRRHHIGTFSSDPAEFFARNFSKDYPRRWEDGSRVAYIEVIGNLGFCSGIRFHKGKAIARKAIPNHIAGNKIREQAWFQVEEVSLGSYKYGGVL